MSDSKIANKRTMYPLYERGAFGNKLRTWSSLSEFGQSDFAASVVLRYSGKAGGGWVEYDVEPRQVGDVVGRWVSEGADRSLIKISEGAPDERLTIQGEVADTAWAGFYVRYSRRKEKMRTAMQHSLPAIGLQARMLLRSYLTPPSYEDIESLLRLYPDAVVEFSAYEMTLGDCRGRNALIWEVRNY